MKKKLRSDFFLEEDWALYQAEQRVRSHLTSLASQGKITSKELDVVILAVEQAIHAAERSGMANEALANSEREGW